MVLGFGKFLVRRSALGGLFNLEYPAVANGEGVLGLVDNVPAAQVDEFGELLPGR